MLHKLNQELTRRRFLHQAGGGLMAAPVAGALLSEASAQRPQMQIPDPPGKKMGWAIVGLGRLSVNQILPAFAKCENAKVTAFVSGVPEKAQKLAARYGVDPKNIYNYETMNRLRDNPDVDIVYIVLPNSMHAEYTVRAHEAGKHVLCEKPMANTPQECQQMVDAARKANRKLMIAYRLRYEPYNMTMIEMARKKELGDLKVVLADAGFSINPPDQWRLKRSMAGGGSLMDIGIYALNAARYITGEEPVAVNAFEYTTPNDPRFKEVEENVNFQLRFPSGVLANCTSSYGVGLNRLRMTGTKGFAELEPFLSYTDLRMRVSRGGVIEQRNLPQRDHFASEMQHLSECVMNNQDPRTPGEEGLRDLKIMMAIYEAARTGKTIKL